jgi:rubrerythrin
MRDETRKNDERSGFAEMRTRNVTFWRCTTCGGLNKTKEQPEICELCGEGKTFEKMKLKIKTNPTHET